VDGHVRELEEACGVDVTSRSWVADDVAPVGTMVFGGLGREPVATPNWIIVTMAVRRDHCSVTGVHATLARRTGRALAWVTLDDGRVEAEGDFPSSAVNPPTVDGSGGPQIPLSPHGAGLLGGVYRRDLAGFLGAVDDG
jgi:hypothetical protein